MARLSPRRPGAESPELVIVAGEVTLARTGVRSLRMEILVVPDPPEPVRAALEQAVRDATPPDGGASAWWRAGLAEAVEEDGPL
jgi:hypothetical protein